MTFMRALVTGASGFIGRFFIPFLLEKNLTVRVLVRNFRYDFPQNVEQHLGDLTNSESLSGAANEVDIVFHLGGYAHAWNENADVEEKKHQQINWQGTQFILEESIRSGVKKFIFFSSIKAVGDTPHCMDEQWKEEPNTPYGVAKRKAEELILSLGKKHALPVCVLRLALVYGPGLKGNLLQMLRAIDKGYFLALPPVQNYRSLVSVYDVCQAAWLAAINEEANGKIYFVADQESYSTHQIEKIMRHALGRAMPRWYIPYWVFKTLAFVGDQFGRLLRRRLPFNSQTLHKLFGSSQCSSKKIQEELGFSPNYPFEKLLPQIVKAYRAGQS